jgi:hypothetical protein
MILLALTSRACSARPVRRVPGAAAGRGRAGALIRNVFDLSANPSCTAALVCRNLLLVAVACLCYCLGAGAARFIQSAPLLAALAGGAVLAGIIGHLMKND